MPHLRICRVLRDNVSLPWDCLWLAASCAAGNQALSHRLSKPELKCSVMAIRTLQGSLVLHGRVGSLLDAAKAMQWELE